MGTENFIQNKMIPISVGTLILIALAATIIPAYMLLNISGVKYFEFVNFLGINLVLIVAGSLFLAFFLIRQWKICIDHANMKEEKDDDNIRKKEIQNQLNKDAETRRAFERERNQVNDMFRLFELAKEKPEEITDRTKTKEKGDVPKQIGNDITTKKNEILNTDKLAILINQYQNLISKQETKTL